MKPTDARDVIAKNSTIPHGSTVDWDKLKRLANECGIFTDDYGDPVCSDWDAVLRFAKRASEFTDG